MIIMLIIIGLFVVNLIAYILERVVDLDTPELLESIEITVITFSAFAGIICGVIILFMSIDSGRRLQALKIERSNYIQILESGVYKDDINISDIQTIKEIQSFNECIQIKQLYAKNVWVNWFIPKCFNEIEQIDLTKYLKN